MLLGRSYVGGVRPEGAHFHKRRNIHVSYKAEVIVDKSGKWCDNAIRFATASEVHEYTDLEFRWAAIRETRVVGSDDPVNYVWADGRLMPRVERAMNIKTPGGYVCHRVSSGFEEGRGLGEPGIQPVLPRP